MASSNIFLTNFQKITFLVKHPVLHWFTLTVRVKGELMKPPRSFPRIARNVLLPNFQHFTVWHSLRNCLWKQVGTRPCQLTELRQLRSSAHQHVHQLTVISDFSDEHGTIVFPYHRPLWYTEVYAHTYLMSTACLFSWFVGHVVVERTSCWTFVGR